MITMEYVLRRLADVNTVLWRVMPEMSVITFSYYVRSTVKTNAVSRANLIIILPQKF